MAKHNKDEFTFIEEETFVVPEPVLVAVVVKAPVAERVRTLSFHQWASRKGIKKQHMSGIMAFIKDYSRDRSMEDWDKAVNGY